MGYCGRSKVKSRVLIAEADDSYNDILDEAIEEASRTIDEKYLEYDATVYTHPSTLLSDCTADFAAYYFKRRHTPQDVEGAGWYQQGQRKLDIIVKSQFKKGKVVF